MKLLYDNIVTLETIKENEMFNKNKLTNSVESLTPINYPNKHYMNSIDDKQPSTSNRKSPLRIVTSFRSPIANQVEYKNHLDIGAHYKPVIPRTFESPTKCFEQVNSYKANIPTVFPSSTQSKADNKFSRRIGIKTPSQRLQNNLNNYNDQILSSERKRINIWI